MTAPNIVNVASITGKTTGYAVTTSLASTGITNPANSNQVIKVNSIACTNISGATAQITVSVYKAGTTHFYLAYVISVPAGSSLLVSSKNVNPVYLEEGDSIHAQASASGVFTLVASYEVIS